jgi:hypothetical protein
MIPDSLEELSTTLPTDEEQTFQNSDLINEEP